jgi:hypothetical protein
MEQFLNLGAVDLDRPIYRITTFARLVEHFRTGKLGLVRAEKWDDPFENYIASTTYKQGNSTVTLALRQIVHGSCWTRKSASDAMWRIYSPDKVSVRVSSTPRLLGEALTQGLIRNPRSSWFIGRVKYLPQREILARATSAAEEILKTRSEAAAASSYLYKRNSFSHEDEVRILVLDRHNRARKGVLNVAVDPFIAIKSVLIDSRAPESIVDVYRTYLKNELGFSGRVTKSNIYRPPEPLVVQIKSFR